MRYEERVDTPFRSFGTEETQNIESYEKRVHGTREVEPQHQYSCTTYTERRTMGKDENGDYIVRIENNPKDSVRPATPVRPVTPVGPVQEEHLLKPVEPFDTLPLSIPRIDIRKNGGLSRNSNSPRSVYSHNEQFSPKSPDSSKSARSGVSPRSVITTSSGSQTKQVPLKKIIRKSRWVSIHDGRPVSPFVETVTYEPKYPRDPYYDRYLSLPKEVLLRAPFSRQIYPDVREQGRYRNNFDSKSAARFRFTPEYRFNPATGCVGECAFIIENPLYRE